MKRVIIILGLFVICGVIAAPVRGLVSGRASAVSGNGEAKLPYDAVVEYLKGTGTQYLDTGLLADNDYELSCKFKTESSYGKGYHSMWGCYEGTGSKQCFFPLLYMMRRDLMEDGMVMRMAVC